MFRRLFLRSRFLKKMNLLMEAYAITQNSEKTYGELLKLEPLIKNEGERAMYNLNRACLMYDMKEFRKASDIVVEIHSLNPEFNAHCADLRTKIMIALNRGDN